MARKSSPWPPLPQLALVACAVVTLLLLLAMTLTRLAASGSHKHAAFAMSLGAGAATGIGASFVLCTSSLDRRLLACTMAFSAGVMIYVSLVEVVHVATEHFGKGTGAMRPASANLWGTLSLFAGVVLMSAVDRLVHAIFDAVAGEHAHAPVGSGGGGGGRADRGRRVAGADEEAAAAVLPHAGSDQGAEEMSELFEDEGGASIRALAHVEERRKLLTMAAVIGTAIVLHNIPEGMATYVASFHSVEAGAPLALAIAIHNIPEGLAVAMPILYATGSKVKAVGLGALSGMSEPFGAVLASFVANETSSDQAFGGMFGLTGGMMLYVCISELLPAAYGEKGVSRESVTIAFFLGCAVMAASLVVEKFAAGDE